MLGRDEALCPDVHGPSAKRRRNDDALVRTYDIATRVTHWKYPHSTGTLLVPYKPILHS